MRIILDDEFRKLGGVPAKGVRHDQQRGLEAADTRTRREQPAVNHDTSARRDDFRDTKVS